MLNPPNDNSAIFSPLIKLDKLADELQLSIEDVNELVKSGELTTVGPQKNLVRRTDLNQFLGLSENILRKPIDIFDYQRSNPSHSKEEDIISEEAWDEMAKAGIKEVKPYYDSRRGKWHIALSLGYDENHKRLRKVLNGDSEAEVWGAYGVYMAEQKAKENGGGATSQGVVPPPIVIISNPEETVTKPVANPRLSMTLEDYIWECLDKWQGSVNGKTYINYVWCAGHICDAIGSLQLRELNKAVLQKYINSLTIRTYQRSETSGISHYAQSSINKIYDFLHKVVKDAADEDGEQLLEKDFLAKVKKPVSQAVKADKEEYPFSDDELKLINDAIISNKLIYTWASILSYTGMRPSEPFGLKFTDIHYESNLIDVYRTLGETQEFDTKTKKSKGPKKPVIKRLKNEKPNGERNYQRRQLKVSPRLMSIIKEYENYVKGNIELMALKRINGTEEYLFCGPRGQFWLYRDYKQDYERLLDSHNIDSQKMFPYRFRHTVCTRLLRQGHSLKAVQLVMGDNTPDMILRVYANLNKEDVFKAGDKLAEELDLVYTNDGGKEDDEASKDNEV